MGFTALFINEEYESYEAPGDCDFLMSLAYKDGIQSFESVNDVLVFIKQKMKEYIIHPIASDADYIFNNYQAFKQNLEAKRAEHDTLKGFMKNDLPFGKDELGDL